ncbi:MULTISPECIES: hypothetical protein [Yersiniaceae]|uniref:Uncharacterized protein n=1 Tax=Nissabacter archeti TaxID=1917880 RepID=A0ABS5JEI8_9GAMM|nr:MULTISPECIES: hypothetical protein [Yersiniaceae]MBS0968357.1 hypothetical protein [Nissabacter archeti]MDV5139556.1 hypothetical protein [Chimaeribacter arupi]
MAYIAIRSAQQAVFYFSQAKVMTPFWDRLKKEERPGQKMTLRLKKSGKSGQ